MKLSSAFALPADEEEVARDEDEDDDGTGSRMENTGGFTVGLAIGTPRALVVLRGGGGALARDLLVAAARCRRSMTMGTTIAAVETAI